MIKIKICGITNLEDAIAAVKLGADAIGFVFWKNSSRWISPKKVSEIVNELPPFFTRVGVFVDAEEREVREITDVCKLDALQFHGKESPNYCRRFKEKRVIKAFRIKDKKDVKLIGDYDVDAYLLDTHTEGKQGGTGITFDWNLALSIKKYGMPFILSGGLRIDNVMSAIRKVKPYAVDVSSGVERYPGKKDHRLIRDFIRQVKQSQD